MEVLNACVTPKKKKGRAARNHCEGDEFNAFGFKAEPRESNDRGMQKRVQKH